MPLTWFDDVTLTVEAALSTAPPIQIANLNPFFESGLADWSGVNGTVAWSSAYAHEGQYSMLITPNGASATVGAQTGRFAVTPLVSYPASAWIYIPAGWSDVRVVVDWFTSGGAFISTGGLTGAATAVPAGVPTFVSQSLTAPSTAAAGLLRIRMGSTPPPSVVAHVDEAMLVLPMGGVGLWEAGSWDSAVWGPDVVWQDISAWIRSIKTDRKFVRDVQTWGTGTAELVLLNNDGRFSPSNLAGPYVVAGKTSIRPWRPVRVRATYAGVTYDLYRGYALDWLETWDPSDAVATVTVPCVDEWGRLARFNGLVRTPVGAGELSGRRVHRILDAAGHAGARNIDLGRVTMLATDLSKNATDELKTTVDSEGGGLFVDGDGTVCSEHQYALMENARSNTVQATFVDDNNAGKGLPVFDMSKSYGGDLVVNIAAFQRVGGTQQVVTDEASRSLTVDLTESRTDLMCETDSQVHDLATLYVQLHKDPEDRIKQAVLKPRARPAVMYPQLLARRVRDLVRVIRSPRTGGYTIDQPCHIAGIGHEIDKDDWKVTVDFSSATVYQTYANSRFDVGTWDGAAWFF